MHLDQKRFRIDVLYCNFFLCISWINVFQTTLSPTKLDTKDFFFFAKFVGHSGFGKLCGSFKNRSISCLSFKTMHAGRKNTLKSLFIALFRSKYSTFSKQISRYVSQLFFASPSHNHDNEIKKKSHRKQSKCINPLIWRCVSNGLIEIFCTLLSSFWWICWW